MEGGRGGREGREGGREGGEGGREGGREGGEGGTKSKVEKRAGCEMRDYHTQKYMYVYVHD